MNEKQLDLFYDEPDDPSVMPPIGSEWEKIEAWADWRTWDGNKLTEIIYDTLGLEESISMLFLRHILWVCKVFDIKQQNYGPANIAKLGEDGIMSRVELDKFSRLKTLNANPDKAMDGEPALDAWHDSAVYGLLGAMVHVGDWPTKEELGLNSKSVEEVCKEAIASAADPNGMSAHDALRYIEENLPK